MHPKAPSWAGPNVSVFIMTHNEELNIARCLDSVRWSNEVVVLDSFSNDRTTQIARSYDNVTVHHRRFDDYASQRNYGVRNVRYRNSWLLMVDADEVVEPELAAELRHIASSDAVVDVDVFLLRRKVFLEGRWVKRNVEYNVWLGRFLRPDKVRFEGIVHEKPVFVGNYALLRGALEHHPFSKGVDDWLARRCRYALLEAQSLAPTGFRVRDLLSKDVLARRAALKAFYRRLPAKWLVYFTYNFAFKLPYLDGWRGMRYVLLETYSLFLAARSAKEKTVAQASQARPAASVRTSVDGADLLHHRHLQHEVPALLRARCAE